MTNTERIAARHGGVAAHCAHSDVSICSRCPVPLHVAGDATMAYQFPSAVAAVSFLRENYDAVMGR